MSHDGPEPLCDCGIAAERKVANTAANQGREFWSCASRACKYFNWCDGRGNRGRGGCTRGRGGHAPRFGGRGAGGAAPPRVLYAAAAAPRQAYVQPQPPPTYDPYADEAQADEEGCDPISDQDMCDAVSAAEARPPPAKKQRPADDDLSTLRDVLVTSVGRLTAVIEKCNNLCLTMERNLLANLQMKPEEPQSQPQAAPKNATGKSTGPDPMYGVPTSK